MRAPLLCAGLLGALLVAAVPALTASSSVPTSVAGHRSITLTAPAGTVMRSTAFRVTGTKIDRVVVKFPGSLLGGLLSPRTVYAKFGTNEVTCSRNTLSLGGLLGTETTATCNLVVLEDAKRPRPLTIRVV